MAPRFDQRSTGEEIMDDLDCSGPVVLQTLRELDFINRFLGGNDVTLNGLSQLLRTPQKQVALADLGCGSGDILKRVYQWGKTRAIEFNLIGIDANPQIIAYAKAHTTELPGIRFEALNILSEDFKNQQFDIILCTLFTHHFRDEELVEILASLKKQARIGIVINDIHRHWLAYHSIRLLTRLFSKSSMVKYDAPLSVLRAFRRAELVEILQHAGISNYRLRWRWAFRWQLVIWP